MDYDKNWRERIGKKRNEEELNWRFHLHAEYVKFLLEVEQLSEKYNWDLWGGGVNNYAVTLSQFGRDGKHISVRLHSGYNYQYYVSYKDEWNPNNIDYDSYRSCIGKTMEEALGNMEVFLRDNVSFLDLENQRRVVLGGAYDRFPLAYQWALEERDGVL